MNYKIIPCIYDNIKHSIIRREIPHWGIWYRLPVWIQKSKNGSGYILDTVKLLEDDYMDGDIFDIIHKNGDIFIKGIKNVRNIIGEYSIKVDKNKINFQSGANITFPMLISIPRLLEIYLERITSAIEGYIDIAIRFGSAGNIIYLDII